MVFGATASLVFQGGAAMSLLGLVGPLIVSASALPQLPVALARGVRRACVGFDTASCQRPL